MRERRRNKKEEAETLARENMEEMSRKKEEATKVGLEKCGEWEKGTEVSISLTCIDFIFKISLPKNENEDVKE